MAAKRTQAPCTFARLVRTATMAICVGGITNGLVFGATVIDETKLPPPATNHVEFARDIKPILEHSCLRCHASERPKSRFSLVTRESALKGGESGVDIVSGDSARSPLVHYVARLVEDLEMPPTGKGESLTPEQIGLLRAWIDQGVVWETTPPESLFVLTVSPTLGWTTVNGDEKKFRELQGQREGWNGGAENFLLTDTVGKDSKLTLEGRTLFDDYRVVLTLEKNEFGFARFGWEQYRKYYDDIGGYFPDFNPSTFSLNQDLHLDVGRAWADFGLTLPNWPRMVLGYEYQYREGDKSTLQWGAVRGGGLTRNIYPASKSIDEQVHIIKFNLNHEIVGVGVDNSFRGEFYDLHTHRNDPISYTVGSAGPSRIDDVRESNNYFQGANAFRLQKSFTDWLHASGGYLYSKLNADATFSLDTQFSPGAPGIYDRWNSQDIVLERETHAFNLSSLLGPWDGFTISAGLVSDWTRQTGFGRANLERVTPFVTNAWPATLDGDSDTTTVEESVALRYTKIPFTVLFAEGRLQQESRGVSEDASPQSATSQSPTYNYFMQRTDTSSDLLDYRAGFSTSPWQRISLSAHYRHYDKSADYNHPLDDSSRYAYPAFIRSRDTKTDGVETKLTLRPCGWLKTSFTYKYDITEYRISTDPLSSDPGDNAYTPGGGLESANSDSHTYSLNATLTPWRRLYLSGTFSYQNTSLKAFDNNNPSVVPYRGDRFSTLASATYALNNSTDLHCSYCFSRADYSQNNYADGLPLGIHYQDHVLTAGLARRISKNISAKLQYRFYYYDEPSSGGAGNYTAQAVFATLVVRIP